MVQKQQTLNEELWLTGWEPYGGKATHVGILPAEPNTGIRFITNKGTVEAKLENAIPYSHSILLKNGNPQVLVPEHILAALFGYGIDNADILLIHSPSISFKLMDMLGVAAQIHVCPYFDGREKVLCERLEEAGIKEQSEPRKLVTLEEKVAFKEDGKTLELSPSERPGLWIHAKTNYLRPGIEQEVDMQITPETFKNELSESRSYARMVPYWFPLKLASAIASFAYPHYGIGHGFSKSTVFLPTRTKEQWEAQEIYPAELARHKIVDFLGVAELLGARLDNVQISIYRTNHVADLNYLRQLSDSGKLKTR